MNEEEIGEIEKEIEDWSEEDIDSLTGGNQEDDEDDEITKFLNEASNPDVEDFNASKTVRRGVEILSDEDDDRELEDYVEKQKAHKKTNNNEEDGKKQKNQEHTKFLVEKYDVDEEYIIARQDEYEHICKAFQPIDEDEIDEDKIKEMAIGAKKNTEENAIDRISETMVRSIMKTIDEDMSLEPITSSGLYVQKEQMDFFLSVVAKINLWKEKINNNPQEIIEDKYIEKLFREFSYKVLKVNTLTLEEKLAGKNGFKNFAKMVKKFVKEDQAKAIDDMLVFLDENNIDNIQLEKVFKI